MAPIQTNRRQDDSWHFDKKVPISIIGAVLFQAAIFIWTASAFNSRVDNLEKTSERTAITTNSSATDVQSVKDRVLKLEISLTNIDEKLTEIKEILSKKVK